MVKGNELVLEEEIGDLYYHRQNLEIPLKTEEDGGIKYGKFKVEDFKIEKSPLRRVINLNGNYFSLRWPYRLTTKMKPLLWRQKSLSFSKKIIIYKDLPRIDFITEIDNRHPQIRIRLKFATDIKSIDYASETQFGTVKRPVNQYFVNPKEEWAEKPSGIYPSLNWINYSNKSKGITLINKGMPAHEIREGNIYLTLLRSISMLSTDGSSGPAIPTPNAMELKKYTYHYSLFPHRGDWKKSSCFSPAYEFNYPLVALQLKEKKTKPLLPSHLSFLEIKPKSLIISAFKKPESKEKEVILRFFEAKGEKTKAEIHLFKKPKSVKMVNLLEEDGSDKVEIRDKKIRLDVKPFEIVTLKIRF